MPACRFEIGIIPPSTNHMYIQVGKRRILAPEIRSFKDAVTQVLTPQAKSQSASVKSLKGRKLIVVVNVASNWTTKSGGIKKADICNREKALMDSVFDALRFVEPSLDDSQIWQIALVKTNSTNNKTIIGIEPLEVNNE